MTSPGSPIAGVVEPPLCSCWRAVVRHWQKIAPQHCSAHIPGLEALRQWEGARHALVGQPLQWRIVADVGSIRCTVGMAKARSESCNRPVVPCRSLTRRATWCPRQSKIDPYSLPSRGKTGPFDAGRASATACQDTDLAILTVYGPGRPLCAVDCRAASTLLYCDYLVMHGPRSGSTAVGYRLNNQKALVTKQSWFRLRASSGRESITHKRPIRANSEILPGLESPLCLKKTARA